MTRHPFQALAVGLWVALLLGVGGRVAFGPVRSQTVVPVYLGAAKRWACGEDVYAIEPPLDVFRYPPGAAAAFVPLAQLPERIAGLIWRGIGAAVLLLGLRMWVRQGLSPPLSPGETGAVFALVAPLALPSLNNGQANVLIAGLLLLGATAATRLRGRFAGLWFALAAGVKVYPLAVGLLIACGNPRRILPALLLGCTALAAFPFLLQAPEYVVAEYRTFLRLVRMDDRAHAHEPDRWPRDLRMALRVWVGDPSPVVYGAIQLVTAMGMAGLVAVVARRTRNPRIAAPLALHLGCVWITVLGPATEVHTYTLLGPTAAVVTVFAFVGRREPGGSGSRWPPRAMCCWCRRWSAACSRTARRSSGSARSRSAGCSCWPWWCGMPSLQIGSSRRGPCLEARPSRPLGVEGIGRSRECHAATCARQVKRPRRPRSQGAPSGLGAKPPRPDLHEEFDGCAMNPAPPASRAA